jgi:hypothetical protein
MTYFKLELPYSTSMRLPVEGSEAFVKYLQRGVLVSRNWRDDHDVYIKEKRSGITLTLVDTVVQDPPPPPEPIDEND